MCRSETSYDRALERIIEDVRKAYAERDKTHAIPDSDLDDEQPITLYVRTTLGDMRKLQRGPPFARTPAPQVAEKFRRP